MYINAGLVVYCNVFISTYLLHLRMEDRQQRVYMMSNLVTSSDTIISIIVKSDFENVKSLVYRSINGQVTPWHSILLYIPPHLLVG